MANELAQRQQTLKTYLMQPSVTRALRDVGAKQMDPEKLTRVALVAISRNQKLLECTPESLLRSLMDSAKVGLDPTGGTLGEGYLVPYWNKKTQRTEAQFIPGYRGLAKLARQSKGRPRVMARVVYGGDKFKVDYGTAERIVHEPDLHGNRDDDNIVAAYAVATFEDGSQQLEVMTRKEINGIRARSKAKDSGPWVTDFGEMCRKTTVRRLCKYLPMALEDGLATALALDDNAESGIDVVEAPLQGIRETGALSVEDLVPSEDANRGHGQEKPPANTTYDVEAGAPTPDSGTAQETAPPPDAQPAEPLRCTIADLKNAGPSNGTYEISGQIIGVNRAGAKPAFDIQDLFGSLPIKCANPPEWAQTGEEVVATGIVVRAAGRGGAGREYIAERLLRPEPPDEMGEIE